MWLGFRESSCPYVLFWLAHRGFHRVIWQKWEMEHYFVERNEHVPLDAVEKAMVTPVGSS